MWKDATDASRASALEFQTLTGAGALTTQVTIDGAGKVGVGTTSPDARLDVSGFIRTTGLTGSPVSGAGLELLYNSGSGGIGQIQAYDRGGSVYKILFLDGSTTVINGATSGKVGIGNTSPTQPLHMASGAHVTAGGVWTNASSREMKDRIEDLSASRAVAALDGLNPVTFVYRADPTEAHVGFVAEDVPELVATQDRKSLAAMDIVAVLTKVVQEQQHQLDDQAQQLYELSEQQGMNVELRARLARLESLLAGADAWR